MRAVFTKWFTVDKRQSECYNILIIIKLYLIRTFVAFDVRGVRKKCLDY